MKQVVYIETDDINSVAPDDNFIVKDITNDQKYVFNNGVKQQLRTSANGWTAVTRKTLGLLTSDATVNNDTELTTALAVGSYVVRGRIYLTTANATMGYRFAHNFTGSNSTNYYRCQYTAPGDGWGSLNYTALGANPTTEVTVSGSNSGICYVEFEYILQVTTAGSYQFQWAQNVSDAGALLLGIGSYIEFLPI
ncbi:hypothetical protein UFOVP402_22 [uncultured Caudovirales phage]|uniref:Uncharacterized protein n=1 Tax=uncultured Caudovirales phage TaxID=2100421 RepID=A0A6J5M2D8_9CAUD|nr:hypothetical protein UFOVP402_22 [uncultured Caudovirales phage]